MPGVIASGIFLSEINPPAQKRTGGFIIRKNNNVLLEYFFEGLIEIVDKVLRIFKSDR